MTTIDKNIIPYRAGSILVKTNDTNTELRTFNLNIDFTVAYLKSTKNSGPSVNFILFSVFF
jgi:hypothetical protein